MGGGGSRGWSLGYMELREGGGAEGWEVVYWA